MAKSADEELQKWRDLVGGFILAFGDIELITYRMWAERFKRRQPPHRFAARTRQLLSQLNGEDEQTGEVRALLQSALTLAKRRNTVAHNPLQVDVFVHTNTGQIFAEAAISAYGAKDRIDDRELMELRSTADDIANRLYKAIGLQYGIEREKAS